MRNLAIAVSLLAVLSSGCALVGGGQEKQDGSDPSWTIMGADENWAFNTADDKCPHGYYVDIELPNRPLPPLYIMEIRCKSEMSKDQDLVFRPVVEKPYNPLGIGEPGQFSYHIEHMPEVKACKKTLPEALIVSKSPGIEVYKVACANGSELKFRCELNLCKLVNSY